MKLCIFLAISALAGVLFPMWASYYNLPDSPPWVTLWFLWTFGSIIALIPALIRTLG